MALVEEKVVKVEGKLTSTKKDGPFNLPAHGSGL
jgi:hypothetical protein